MVILVLYVWLYLRYIFLEIRQLTVTTLIQGDGGRRDRIVVGLITTLYLSPLWRGVLSTTLCNKVCQ